MNPYSQNFVAHSTHNEYQTQFAQVERENQVEPNVKPMLGKMSNFIEDRVDTTALTYLLALALIGAIPFLV